MIIELADRVSKETQDERKLILLEELRKLLNEEKELLHANIETLLPHAGMLDQLREDRSSGAMPIPDPNGLRKQAEGLRMKALNLIQEAEALALQAENLEKAVAAPQRKVKKADAQAA